MLRHAPDFLTVRKYHLLHFSHRWITLQLACQTALYVLKCYVIPFFTLAFEAILNTYLYLVILCLLFAITCSIKVSRQHITRRDVFYQSQIEEPNMANCIQGQMNLRVQGLKNLHCSLQPTSFGHAVQQLVPPATFVALVSRLQSKMSHNNCFSHSGLSASAGWSVGFMVRCPMTSVSVSLVSQHH